VFNSSPLAAYNIRMSEYIHKRHNVTVLLYYLVFPAKYRRAVVDGNIDETIRDVCLKLEDRYQLKFLEIGTDEDHVHFLVQSVPTYAVSRLVCVPKSKSSFGAGNFGATDILVLRSGGTAMRKA
jgi:REP element-mobilizing transposase RayT